MSLIKIMATTRVSAQDGQAVYMTDYVLTEALNGHINGGVSVPVGNMTESEFNAVVQQAVADKANIETASSEFTASDVLGGRL